MFRLLLSFTVTVAVAATSFNLEFNNIVQRCEGEARERIFGKIPRFPKSYAPGPPPRIPLNVDYVVTPVREGNLYYIADRAYQTMVVVNPDVGITVIDAPPSQISFLYTAIREAATMAGQPNMAIARVMYSHHHLDHTGAMKQLVDEINAAQGGSVEIWGTIGILRPMELANGDQRFPNRPLPTRTIDDRSTAPEVIVDAGTSVPIKIVLPVGVGHSVGSVIFEFTDHRVLFGVDYGTPGDASFRRVALSTDTLGYSATSAKIVDIMSQGPNDWVYLGGHGPQGNLRDMQNNLGYTQDIIKYAGQGFGICSTTRGEELAEGTTLGSNGFFRNLIACSADYCNELVQAAWTGILYEVDVFTFDNCAAVVDAFIVEQSPGM